MQVKPGVKTTEFAVVIVTAILDYIPNFVPTSGKWAGTVAAVAYAISRGITKWGAGPQLPPVDFTGAGSTSETSVQSPTRQAAINDPTTEELV